MKILSLLSLVIALIGFSSGLYCQIEYMPKVDQSEIFGPDLYFIYMEDKFFFGSIALFAGIAAVLVSFYPVIKKQKIAMIAILLGLVSVFFGLIQSTHMFS